MVHAYGGLLFKAFTLHDGVRFQFRAEVLDPLNAAGSVTLTQLNDPRNAQIAVKILF